MNRITPAPYPPGTVFTRIPDPPYRPEPPRRARGGMGEGVRCPVCRRELIARVTANGVGYPCSCKP